MAKLEGFAFEVEDLGCDHAQYFPGFGVAFSQYTHSALGGGSSAREAGEDALEQFWQSVDKRTLSVADAERLENMIKELSEEEDAHNGCQEAALAQGLQPGTPEADKEHENCEWYHYVGIRWVQKDEIK